MNKQDRAELTRAYAMIDEAKGIVEAVAEAEQEKFDNLSEGLQASERGQRMGEVASELQDACAMLADVLASIEGAQE